MAMKYFIYSVMINNKQKQISKDFFRTIEKARLFIKDNDLINIEILGVLNNEIVKTINP